METDLETEISDLENEMSKWRMKYDELKKGKDVKKRNRTKRSGKIGMGIGMSLGLGIGIQSESENENENQTILKMNSENENEIEKDEEEEEEEEKMKKYEEILRDFQYLKRGEMVSFTNQHFFYCHYVGKYSLYGGFRSNFKYLQWMMKPKRGFLVGIENVVENGNGIGVEIDTNIKNRYFIIRNSRNRDYKILESDYDIFYRFGEPVNHKSKLRKKLEEVTNAKSLRVRRKRGDERMIDLEKEMRKYMEKVQNDVEDQDIYEKIDGSDDESDEEREGEGDVDDDEEVDN